MIIALAFYIVYEMPPLFFYFPFLKSNQPGWRKPPDHNTMPPKKDLDSTAVLVWSDSMIATFLRLLEEQHDLGKRSNTGFKPEAWAIFRDGIQAEFTGSGYIRTEKIRSKLDYVSETL